MYLNVQEFSFLLPTDLYLFEPELALLKKLRAAPHKYQLDVEIVKKWPTILGKTTWENVFINAHYLTQQNYFQINGFA